jgi:hypothetical protein
MAFGLFAFFWVAIPTFGLWFVVRAVLKGEIPLWYDELVIRRTARPILFWVWVGLTGGAFLYFECVGLAFAVSAIRG